MTEDKQNKKLDDATKAFEEAERDFMVNNSKEEKNNMEKKIKNDKKDEKEKHAQNEKLNLSIAIGVAVLFCFSVVLFFLH